jgi:hypothetical protein
LSILDAAAVERTLADLTVAERRRTRPDADQIATAFESLVATHRGKGSGSVWTRDISPPQSSPVMLDLVVEGIGRLFER